MKFKTPCQFALWYTLPAIRKEIAIMLVKEYKLSQKEIAKLLGITEAAVSYYIHKKRGRKMKLTPDVRKKLRKLVNKIVKHKGSYDLTKNLCEICRLVNPRFR